MSKKILSMALAVIMLISVFAFSASAANTTVTTTFPEAGYCGFRVVSDAYVGMPAGQPVTVKVYWVLPFGADRPAKMSDGKWVIAYNSAKYTLNTAVESPDATNANSAAYDARTWGDAYSSFFKSDAPANMQRTTINNVIKNLTEAEKVYGWDMVLSFATAYSTDSVGVNKDAGYDFDYDCEIFSLSFTTAGVITANDVIGIPSATFTQSRTQQYYSNGTKATVYAKTKYVNSEPAVPAVSSVNETSGAKFRMSEDEGKVDLGITGTVKSVSLDPGKTFENGRYVAANLTAVGVQARVDGVVAAAEDGYVYETSDGYQFRAAITGMDEAGLSKDIDVRTYITDNAGNTYFSNWMNIDAKTAHNASVSASGGKFAGIL